MKKLQKYRLLVQLLSTILFAVGLIIQLNVTLVIIMIGTIFAGAYHCGWICPYGTLQELSSKLGNKLGIKKRKMPKAIQQYLVYVRYIIFAIFMLFTVDILFSLMLFDPRTNLQVLISGNVITVTSIIVLTLFLVISLFFERPFCNYLCIEGAKYGLLSLLRPVTIKRNEDSCINCKKCDKVCPMNIAVSVSEQLHSPNCINCFQCTDVCPVKDTLTYGPIRITSKRKTYYIQMVLLAVVIGTGFLFYSIAADNETQNISVIASSETIIDDSNIEESQTESLDNGTHGNGKGNQKNRENSNNESEATNNQLAEESDVDVIDNTQTNTNELASASGIANGTYSGVGRGFRGNMTVEVAVQDEEITNVEVVKHVDDYKWFVRAYDTVVSRILSAQSVDVDTVSGATYTSIGIIEGANAALESGRN